MGFNSFRISLSENSIDGIDANDVVQCIMDIVTDEMDAECVDEFGFYLYSMYFLDDLDDLENDYYEFTVDDIKDMLNAISKEDDSIYILDDILGSLVLDEFDDDNINESLMESVTPYMKASSRNLKKRKFMANSKMYLFRTQQKRKRENLLTKNKRHREYLVNKNRISQYQKSREDSIKKHLHIVKRRKKVGETQKGDRKSTRLNSSHQII